MTRRAAVDAPAAETVAVSVAVVATAEVATAVEIVVAATGAEAVIGAAAVEIASRGSKHSNPCEGLEPSHHSTCRVYRCGTLCTKANLHEQQYCYLH